MESPLASGKCGNCAKYARSSLCAALFAFFLFLTTNGHADESAGSSCYPKNIADQIQRIISSSADEVQPLRQTGIALLENFGQIIAETERNDPQAAQIALSSLEQNAQTWDDLRKHWQIKISTDNDELSYVPSVTALEEIASAIGRRIAIWRILFQAEFAEFSPITIHYEKNYADVRRFKERTLAVDQFFTKSKRAAERQAGLDWCKYFDTESWLSELEACQESIAQPIRRVSTGPIIPAEILHAICNRANVTLAKLESSALDKEQTALLKNPVIAAWKEELSSWSADIVEPVTLLRYLEQYESTSGMSDMKSLYRFAEQLSVSKTAEYKQLGEMIRRQYGMSNLKIFVSQSLLNNHLPQLESEFARFRDRILDRPVSGDRQTDTELAIVFDPHPTKIKFVVGAGVDLRTLSKSGSDETATRLFNVGRTRILAQKPIELTADGFVFDPCLTEIVDHKMRLTKISTDFDNIPLVSQLSQYVVFNQYEEHYPAAQSETLQKIRRQVRSRVNKEVEQRLQPINEKFQTLTKYAAEDFDLKIETQEARTDENWLLTAWKVCSKDALGSSTQAPETLPGAFADLKIHESLLNMLIGKLEFEGKRGKVSEFKELLADKFRQPGLIAQEEESDNVEVTFEPYNPVVVRFADGRAEITISIAALKMNRQTHRHFQVIVRYKPAIDALGRPVLERDGYISLINVRAQILMRAVFGKIFPINKPLPLVPKMLESDPQFAYLTMGHCRIEKGWFALALIAKEQESGDRD